MNHDIIKVFDNVAEQYDKWFDVHTAAFESELNALRKVVPFSKEGLEVGVGSGRYAERLGIQTGLEPSEKLADFARLRHINVFTGTVESMPFNNQQFDYVLLNTVLCFVDDPLTALFEVKRVTKMNGRIIIGMYDINSLLGQSHMARRHENPIWLYAHYHSVPEVLNLLHQINFKQVSVYQTLTTSLLEDIEIPEPVKPGYGEGGFVVISAEAI